MYIWTSTHEGQRRVSDPLVLGTEPRYSARAADALRHRAISPDPKSVFSTYQKLFLKTETNELE